MGEGRRVGLQPNYGEPELPKVLNHYDLWVLGANCKTILEKVRNNKEATDGERALAAKCKEVLALIVTVLFPR